jgi:hypothetical protein
MLDPAVDMVGMVGMARRWIDLFNAVTVISSVGVVLWLSYTYLILFRQVVTGEIQIDFGLPDGVIHSIKQAFSTFVGLCIFYKFLPRDNNSSQKAKKDVYDPVIVRRASKLASEASERVRARGEGKPILRRTTSEGNFGTPPSRRLSKKNLRPLRERAEALRAPATNPLMEIHRAGPALSPTELISKLKENKSIKFRMTRSTSVPVLPRLCEEQEKLLSDVRLSTPTSLSPPPELMKGNPQSPSKPSRVPAVTPPNDMDLSAPRTLTGAEINSLTALLRSHLQLSNSSCALQAEEDATDLLNYALEMIGDGYTIGKVLEELSIMEMEICNEEVLEDMRGSLVDYLAKIQGTKKKKN